MRKDDDMREITCSIKKRNNYILKEPYVRIPDFHGNDVYVPLDSHFKKENLATEIDKSIQGKNTLITDSIRLVIPVDIVDPWNTRRREVIERTFLNYGKGPFTKIVNALNDYEKRYSGKELLPEQVVLEWDLGNQDSYIMEIGRLGEILIGKGEKKSTPEETMKWARDWKHAEESGC